MEAVEGNLVALRGRLDGSGTAAAREALYAALKCGRGELIVDLSAVEVIDATGLGVLVGVHRAAQRAGRRLVLRNVPPRVTRILRITRLERVFDTERSGVWSI